MGETRLLAPCKINLYLRIGARRPDGYHDIRTLFFPVCEPCDELVVTKERGRSLKLACSDPALEGEGNLVARAWKMFAEATGFRPGLRVELLKRTPHGMGLGGGSSDAAAILGYLNEAAGERALGPAGLNALAARLGADVPFFLLGRPAWAEGIGERLWPADVDLSAFSLLVVCPATRVATAWAYGAVDALRARAGSGQLTDVGALSDMGASAGPGGNIDDDPLTRVCVRSMLDDCGTGHVIANDFEPAVFQGFPELRRIKEQLLFHGAAAAALSGSGAGLFGLFRERGRARQAAEFLRGLGCGAFVSRPGGA